MWQAQRADCVLINMRIAAEISERFVQSFEKYDETVVLVHQETDKNKLEAIYSKLPGHLPPLFEELLLKFRWASIDLKHIYLLANPPGNDLRGFENEIFKDKTLSSVLIRGGFVQFGKAAEFNYDPVCFNLQKRSEDGDCQVVQLDHEEILCNSQLKEIKQISPSFRALMELIIKEAKR
jgi:hypothetical protein